MNVLALSFDHALLAGGNATQNESQRRQVAYAEELCHRAPGSRIWIVVRSAPGTTAKPVAIAENLELCPAPSSATGFLSTAYRYGREVCSRHGIDLITSQSPFSDGLAAWLLKSQCKAKLLVQLHTTYLDNPYWLAESYVNRLRAIVGKSVLRHADGARVVSRTAARWLQQVLQVPQDKVFVVPVGTQLASQTLSCSEKHTSDRRILFVGRLVAQKGVLTLLRAFQQIQEQERTTALVIVGDGPERQQLQGLASALKLQDSIRFVGWVPYEQLPRCYSDADLVVVPSLYEPYGRVIVEAMSFGRPVVTTDTEGARDLIQEGQTGFIVPINDVPALASKIQYLLTNPEVAREVGYAARQFIKRTHDPQALCAAQVEMWLKVAGQ